MRVYPAILTLSALVVGVLIGPGSSRATSAPALMAFWATYHGTSRMPSAHQLRETIVATGTATLLGADSLRSSATGVANPGGCIPMKGTGRLQVAGGNIITYRYRVSPCFRPLTSGIRGQAGTFTITGGTGRFRRARGSGTYVELFRHQQHAPPGPVTVTFRGTLRLS